MSRYVDADALIQELKRQYMFLFGTEEIPNGIGMLIENFPTADVVSKEKYDKLNERFHRLLESAKILSDAVREYERREDNEQIH